jgi:hydroxyacylglutathione hydrolase
MTLRVHVITVPTSSVYLIENENGMVLVDAGPPHVEKTILKYIESLGRSDLKLIFITHAHFDHYGSAAALKRTTGAVIAIHSLDAPAMAEAVSPLGQPRGRGKLASPLMPLFQQWMPTEPVQADLLMEDGDDIRDYGLDAYVLHTPGHTPGSSCLIVEDRLAFVGDLISANGYPHVQAYFADDWAQIPISLARLQKIHPQLVYAGHGNSPFDDGILQNLSAEPAS